MNLSIANTLSSNMMLMDRIIEAGQTTVLDDAVNLHDLIETSYEIRSTGKVLLQFLDDLSHAEYVFKDNGYSQELLDTLNADGKFLEAVNLDLTKLVGTDADKLDACMEGLWDAIKNAVAKVWEWILNAIKTVVTWIRRLRYAFSHAEGGYDRAIALIKKVEADKLREFADFIGGSVNALGTAGKMFDARDLVTRVSMDNVIVRYGIKTIDKMCDDKGASYSKWIMDEASAACDDKTGNYKNPLTKEYIDAFGDPMKLQYNGIITGFNGFAAVAQMATIKDSLERSGIRLVSDGNDYSLVIDELSKTVTNIDYAAIYNDPDNYNAVIGVIKNVCTYAEKLDKAWEFGLGGRVSVKTRIEKCKKAADVRMDAHKSTGSKLVDFAKGIDEKAYKFNRYLSMWIGRLILIITRAQMDSMTCRQRLAAITKTVVAKADEFNKK